MRSSILVLSLAKVIGLVGCGLGLTAGPVLSQPRDGAGSCRGFSGRRAGSLADGLVGVMASLGRLNLSQDQQDRVRGVKEEKEATLRAAEALVYGLRRTLHEATVAEVLNEQKIRSVFAFTNRPGNRRTLAAFAKLTPQMLEDCFNVVAEHKTIGAVMRDKENVPAAVRRALDAMQLATQEHGKYQHRT